MKPFFYKTSSVMWARAVRVIKAYKGFLILFFSLFLLGFVTGIFTAGGYASDLGADSLINEYLYKVLTKDTKSLTYFLILTFYFSLVVVFSSVFTRNIFFVVLDAIIMLLSSYVWGFDITIIFVCLGLSGIVLGFLTYGVIGLLFFLNLSLIFAISSFLSFKRRNCEISGRGLGSLYFSLFVVGEIYLFTIAIVFSLIHIFVIVG